MEEHPLFAILMAIIGLIMFIFFAINCPGWHFSGWHCKDKETITIIRMGKKN